MARADLPNPSARAEGTIDRALHHLKHVTALDGGPGDHDVDDFETDTAILHDDIVSLASSMHESVSPPSLQLPGLPRVERRERSFFSVSHVMSRPHNVAVQCLSPPVETRPPGPQLFGTHPRRAPA